MPEPEPSGRMTTRSTPPTPVTDTPEAWLDQFVEAIRGNTLASGRLLFHDEVVGYGVITERMLGLESLVTQQWTPTWKRVATWEVTTVDLRVEHDDIAVIAFCWERTNNDDRHVVAGRATVVLQWFDGRWLCTHSHLSATPSPP